MNFVYSEWERFCRDLISHGIHSVTAADVLASAINGRSPERFVVLKHDVESSPSKALKLGMIEAEYGHRASYYVQAYLMTADNMAVFSKLQSLGHEVTYHHDVIDAADGDIQRAVELYKHNIELFNSYGFAVKTVCQHGNPLTPFDNRDFFRNESVKQLFPDQSDIMVDYMQKIRKEYVYISDAGMDFKIINDPLEQQNLPEDKKSIQLGNLNAVANFIFDGTGDSCIVSSHPHRYNDSVPKAILRKTVFIVIRSAAKLLFKIPGMKGLFVHVKDISKQL